MIKSYADEAAYAAATRSTTENDISLIEETMEVKIDGVNVPTGNPAVGDVLFLDENNEKVFLKGGAWLQPSLIPSNWTHVGYVYMRQGRTVGVIDKNASTQKYLDVVQYAITAISSTSLTINIRMSPDYGVNTAINVTLTSASIDATSASEISAAIAAKATEVGDTKAYWAYLADANGNKVDSGGTQIIVQCDTCVDYRFYVCSATGCTISLFVWGDMPASDVYFKTNGRPSNYRGIMNFARGVAYWSTNGRTPSSDEPLGASGNTNPVTLAAFTSSQYCALLRSTFTSYEDYLRGEYGVMYPQHYGSFALPKPEELSARYALLTAPTKTGGTKYKFPALAQCATVSYSNVNLAAGKWHLPGCLEGCYLMADETLETLEPSITKMNTTAINNSTYRWFAERGYVNAARAFNGNDGYLSTTNVYSGFRAQAVLLLPI